MSASAVAVKKHKTSRNQGQPKAEAIVAKKIALQKLMADEPEPMPEDEPGVDVGHLIGIGRDQYRLGQHCSYGFGDPRSEGFRFCGNPLHAGTQWCEEHYGIVYEAKP